MGNLRTSILWPTKEILKPLHGKSGKFLENLQNFFASARENAIAGFLVAAQFLKCGDIPQHSGERAKGVLTCGTPAPPFPGTHSG
jgi:hypothetical protein